MTFLDDQEGRLKTQLLTVGQKKMGRPRDERGKEHSFGQRWRAGHSSSTLETMSIANGQKTGPPRPARTRAGGGALVRGRPT